MSINPFESSVADHQITHTYRPAGSLLFWLTTLLYLQIALGVIVSVASLVQVTMFPDAFDIEPVGDPGIIALGLGMLCFGLLYPVIFVSTVVVFCVWINRANKNARALGANEMTFTPGWSVGWFFIPIMNLFKPYQATCEIYKASGPSEDGLDWQHSEVSPVLSWWWGLWIISNILGNIETRMAFSDDLDMLIAAGWFSLVTSAVTIPAALLAIKVVRMIHQRQEDKARPQLQTTEA